MLETLKTEPKLQEKKEPIKSGFDRLGESTTSKLAEILFKPESRQAIDYILNNLFDKTISDKKIDILGKDQKDIVNLVILNKIFKELSQPSQSGVANVLVEKFQEINGKEKKEAIALLSPTLDMMNGYIQNLSGNYLENLDKLLNIAKTKQLEKYPKFELLMNNPEVLEKVLETGVYNEDGFKIDITNPQEAILELNGTNDKVEKEAFITKMAGNIDKVGEELQNGKLINFTNIAETLTNSGFSSYQLRDLKKAISEIPIIGKFLAGILGLFLTDQVIDTVQLNELADKHKDVIKIFQEYVGSPENKDNIPFTVIDGKLDEAGKDKNNIVKFLKKIEDQELRENKGEKKPSIISNESFWKNMFSNDKIGEDENLLIERVRSKVALINPEKKEISQSKFLESLANIKFDDTKEKEEKLKSSNSSKPGERLEGGTTESSNETSQEKQIAIDKIDDKDLPAIIEINGKKIEISIDKEKKLLKIGNIEYKIEAKGFYFFEGCDNISFQNGKFNVKFGSFVNKSLTGEELKKMFEGLSEG